MVDKKIFSNDRFGIKNKGVPHYLYGMRNALRCYSAFGANRMVTTCLPVGT